MENKILMRSFVVIVLLIGNTFSFAQSKADKQLNTAEATRLLNLLASDEMQGRKPFTASIDKAARVIATEFRNAGLKFFPGLEDYKQTFPLVKSTLTAASATINGKPVEENNIIAFTTDSLVNVNEKSGYEVVSIDSGRNLFSEAFKLLKEKKDYLVLVNPFHAGNFNRLKRYKRETFRQQQHVIFILSDEVPVSFNIDIKQEISNAFLTNVVGVLPGKRKKDEYVIFSSHYDHLGTGKPNADMDSIYNGANDDAAGTAAVIMLANYFSKKKNNQRTIIFVAFTAEELGGFGSRYFSEQVDPDKVIAMFNIEMIGTESKWGTNSAYITGYEYSDFGKILQDNLTGSPFHFEPDPYPSQKLFYRSDNATLAELGVPAHTISTSKMDSEKYYHSVDDEIETLDLRNMAGIVKAIAISSGSILKGKDTPTRVEKIK